MPVAVVVAVVPAVVVVIVVVVPVVDVHRDVARADLGAQGDDVAQRQPREERRAEGDGDDVALDLAPVIFPDVGGALRADSGPESEDAGRLPDLEAEVEGAADVVVPAVLFEGDAAEADVEAEDRAVFVGGAYRGKAIDRTLFSFEPKAYDIVVEPPVYLSVPPSTVTSPANVLAAFKVSVPAPRFVKPPSSAPFRPGSLRRS